MQNRLMDLTLPPYIPVPKSTHAVAAGLMREKSRAPNRIRHGTKYVPSKGYESNWTSTSGGFLANFSTPMIHRQHRLLASRRQVVDLFVEIDMIAAYIHTGRAGQLDTEAH